MDTRVATGAAKSAAVFEQRNQISSASATHLGPSQAAPTQDDKVAVERSKQWATTLPDEHIALIHNWTGTGHRSMGPEQRAQLLSAIQTAPEYNGRAYRIVVEGSAGNGSLRGATMGNCFDLKLFFHYQKRDLRPRVIEIDLTDAPGKAIAGASTVPGEKEVLIEPDVSLRFTHSKKQWESFINCYVAEKAN